MLRKGKPDRPQRFDLDTFSIRPSLYPKVEGRTNVRINPFAWKLDFRYDGVKASLRYEMVNVLVGSQIIDPHDRLADASKRSSGSRTRAISAAPAAAT